MSECRGASTAVAAGVRGDSMNTSMLMSIDGFRLPGCEREDRREACGGDGGAEGGGDGMEAGFVIAGTLCKSLGTTAKGLLARSMWRLGSTRDGGRGDEGVSTSRDISANDGFSRSYRLMKYFTVCSFPSITIPHIDFIESHRNRGLTEFRAFDIRIQMIVCIGFADSYIVNQGSVLVAV
jgi:hypothetical protein